MLVIFDKEVFIKFLKSHSPKAKSDDILTLIKIFENEKNIIVLTKELIERIENEINSSPELVNLFQGFIKDVFDNNRYKKIDISINDEVDEIIETFNIIATLETKESKFIIIANDYSQHAKFNAYLHYTCIYSNINKPNKCWLIFNLLSGNSVTVRYSDFAGNREIQLFFESVFKFVNRFDEIYLLDSYCNLSNHTLFSPIQKKGYKINICTSSFQKENLEIERLRNFSKEYFGKSNTRVKFSSDKRLLHERTIAFGDVVVESNHDFAEIKRENLNWKLDISICPNLKEEILAKCIRYN